MNAIHYWKMQRQRDS